MKSVARILNKAQQTKYRNMVGEPFDFLKRTSKPTADQPGTAGPDGTASQTPTAGR